MTEAVALDAGLAEAFLARHPSDAARVVEQLTTEQILWLCAETPAAVIAPMCEQLNPVVLSQVMAQLDVDRLVAILGELPIDSAGALMRQADARHDMLLEAMPVDRRTALSRCLTYPPDRAGALMDPMVLTVADSQTVQQALETVARAGKHAHYYVFVVDTRHRLVGVVNLRELYMAPANGVIGSIARRGIARVGAMADRTAIVAHPAWRDLHTLPVVDDAGRFLGVLRYETLRRLELGEPETPVGEAAVTLALALSELYWSGAGALIAELSTAVLSPPEPGTQTR